jgi:hypothetical protein
VLEGEGKDDETLREIQKILYQTEVRALLSLSRIVVVDADVPGVQDGFEVPEGEEAAGGAIIDEEETF